MRKEFNRTELNRWFCYDVKCSYCGKNHWNCFHHIITGSENSLLNAAPLNNENCHLPIHKKLRNKKHIVLLLQKTIEYLLKQGYKLKKEDKEFISRYKIYYIEMVKNKKHVRYKQDSSKRPDKTN